MMLWGVPWYEFWLPALAIVLPVLQAIRDIRKDGDTHDE